MIHVLDASALVAYLRREIGWDVVAEIIASEENHCIVHVMNLCEVFYGIRREFGEIRAQEVLRDLTALGIEFRTDFDTDFWQAAGRLKADYRRVSLPDCFCVTLAMRVGGEVVTTDHHEFDALVPLGLCPIRFIR